MATGPAPAPAPAGGQPPGVSPDTETAVLSKYGLTPEDLQMGAAYGDDEDSMKVYKRTVKKGATPGHLNMAGGLLGVNLREPWVGGSEGTDEDETDTVGNYKKDYYRRAPGELSTLKRRLWEGGFYDQSIDWEDIRQGDYDDETRDAWHRAVKRAAAFYDSGKKLTVDDVIDMAAEGLTDEERASGKHKGSKGRPGLSVVLTHPDDIKTQAMKVSARVLGKGWSEDQLNRFVATFQAMERSAQANEYAATGQAGGTFTKAPDIETAVAKEARASDPVAAGATDYVNAYNMILKGFQSLGAGAGG